MRQITLRAAQRQLSNLLHLFYFPRYKSCSEAGAMTEWLALLFAGRGKAERQKARVLQCVVP